MSGGDNAGECVDGGRCKVMSLISSVLLSRLSIEVGMLGSQVVYFFVFG